MESKENNKKSPNVMGTYLTNPLLTDFYLLTMLYAHWKNKRHDQPAVFDMYFRKCAFGMNVNLILLIIYKYYIKSMLFLEE